jgi:hypothetical protein
MSDVQAGQTGTVTTKARPGWAAPTAARIVINRKLLPWQHQRVDHHRPRRVRWAGA